MSAGSFGWQWADGDKVKTPQQLSAPKYMEKLLVWVPAPNVQCTWHNQVFDDIDEPF